MRRSPVLAPRGLSALVAVVLAACGFETSFDQTRYRCGNQSGCPSQFQCVRGFCEAAQAPGPDASTIVDPPADASVDASGGGGGGGDVDASPAADASTGGGGADAAPQPRFQDGFGDGVLAGWAPWDHPGCTVAETGGFLELSYSGSDNAYCGADTTQRFDLRGGSVSIEVVAAPTLDTFEAYVLLFDGQQQIQMVRGTAGLTMQLKSGSTVSRTARIANDLTAQRHWRIREESGSIVWETSPDGAAWTRRHSAPASFGVSSMQVELAAGHYAPGPGVPVVVRFDRCVVQ